MMHISFLGTPLAASSPRMPTVLNCCPPSRAFAIVHGESSQDFRSPHQLLSQRLLAAKQAGQEAFLPVFIGLRNYIIC